MMAELVGSDNMAPTEEALLRCPPILELKYQNNACESGAPMNQSSSNFVEFCILPDSTVQVTELCL